MEKIVAIKVPLGTPEEELDQFVSTDVALVSVANALCTNLEMEGAEIDCVTGNIIYTNIDIFVVLYANDNRIEYFHEIENKDDDEEDEIFKHDFNLN